MKPSLKIAPSILAANFAELGKDVSLAAEFGADQIHIDVMDGHFVPNISMGPVVVKAIRPLTDKLFDVHLMIDNPEDYLEAFAQAGANALTVHIEACDDIGATLKRIKALGVRAGVAISPPTDIEKIEKAIPYVDIALVMTVNPGFGGQAFIEGSLERIAAVRKMLDKARSEADLSVDGGIDAQTGAASVKAGANVLVAGSAIFKADSGMKQAIADIRTRAQAVRDS